MKLSLLHLDLAEETKQLGHSASDNNACSNVEIAHNVTLKGGTRAGIFKEVGRMVDMKKCVSSCCDKPECDVAYLLNGHCFSVQCLDGSLCQATAEPAKAGDTVALAYMNKAGLGEYKRGRITILNSDVLNGGGGRKVDEIARTMHEIVRTLS